jgi:multiple sugar transport system permease protein
MAATSSKGAGAGYAPPQARGRRWSKQARSEALLAMWFVLPAMVTIALIAFLPLGRAFWLSLWQINLRFANTPRVFVGLGNYGDILQDARFHNALKVSGTIALWSIIAELILGMLIALAINREFIGRGPVRATVLIPWALTTVVSAKMWQLIYQTDFGIFNRILGDLHLIAKPVPWLASPDFALWGMIVAEIWKTTPFAALLLLAGLQLIPSDLYEASALDGASEWSTFWHITLPLLRPTLLVVLLFRFIDVARMFDLPFVLTGGGPGFQTETLTMYTYRVLFTNLQFGMGSALAVMVFAIVLLFSFLFIRVLGAPVGGGGSR